MKFNINKGFKLLFLNISIEKDKIDLGKNE